MVSILDRFKKKETSESVRLAPRAPSDTNVSAPAVSKKGERRLVGFELLPHVTEKTTRGAEHGWYTFRVSNDAGKVAVKQAVEDRYRVHVDRVHISPVRPRTVRIGRTMGTVPGFKKASVKLRAGESIELT
jgi:large subunit ribosomal protein L23